MPLPGKSNKRKEDKAFQRGKHERRKGFDKDMNPFVRTDLDHEPNLYEKWLSGWKVMDAQIEAGNMEEYN